MAKMRDFGIFWFFWTLFTVCITVLGLFVANKCENSVYKDQILEKQLSICEFRNDHIMKFDSEIKDTLDSLVENSKDCYRNFFKIKDCEKPLQKGDTE